MKHLFIFLNVYGCHCCKINSLKKNSTDIFATDVSWQVFHVIKQMVSAENQKVAF